jgi:hypothetical protein
LEATCQRCHETLHHGDRYCPSCGLPQLIYVPEETPVVVLGEERGGESAFAGVGPAGLGDGIAWRPAVRASILLAIPAGVLCSGVSSLGLIWMVAAAAWAVGLYCRRAPVLRLSTGSGARIGLVTGLLASWLALSFKGIDVWVARFLLHQGSQIDSLQTAQVEEKLKISHQLWTAMGVAAAQIAQMSEFSRSWMLSPEGRAGDVLSESLFNGVFLVLFAIVGGALGARLLAQPRRPRA